MKYLGEFFENNVIKFQKNSKTGEFIQKQDGNKFEEIIMDLLNKMFKDIKWTPTPMTNDGNKDFYAIRNGEFIWAECKNYKKSLGMKALSPTLVMAQLNNATEIYFFSVSSINANTKRKICYYSYLNDKKIHFIDDEILENLLINKQNDKYNQYIKEGFNITLNCEPDIFISTTKNPFLNINYDDYMFEEPIKYLEYNDIVALHIFIINNSVLHTLHISYRINQNDNFQYISEDDNLGMHNISKDIILTPNEIYCAVYNFSLLKSKDNITIPHVQIKYNYDSCKEKIIDNKNISVTCKTTEKTPLIGQEYENILNDLEQKLYLQKRLTILYVYGVSGSGKTRILDETHNILAKHKYKIINFTAVDSRSFKDILKEIVFVLYNVTSETIVTIYDNYFANKEDELYKKNNLSIEIKLIYDLLDEQVDVKKYMEKYNNFIFEKLLSDHYAIIVDNIQYYDSGLCDFLNELVIYSGNTNRNLKLVLILSMNLDYLKDNKTAQKLSQSINGMSETNYMSILQYKIQGFCSDKVNNTENGLLFLKQLLRLNDSRFDDSLNKLISNINYNPYYIKNFAKYIINNNIINYKFEGTQVLNKDKFFRIIENFPEELSLSFEKRIEYIQKERNLNQRDLKAIKQIISCIHIFRGLSDIDLQNLKMKSKYINMLEDYSFIKQSGNKYIFDHDLLENYFEHKYGNQIYCALGSLSYKKITSINNTEVKFLYLLYRKHISTKELENAVQYATIHAVSYRNYFKYYELCKDKLFKNFKKFNETDSWIKLALSLSNNMRDRFGGKYSYEYYEYFYNTICNYINNKSKQIKLDNFSEFMFAVGESMQHKGKYYDVTSFYLEYLPLYEAIENKSEKIASIIAFIHSRLSLAYAHLANDENRLYRDNHISMSISKARSLNNKQYIAEAIYNKASFMYYKRKDENAYYKMCKASCELVKIEKIKLMTLHNIQREIRCAFVKRQHNTILSLIEAGDDYLKSGEYNEYHYFFSKFFRLAEGLYYLLKNDYVIALKTIQKSIEESEYFGTDNVAYQHFLLAKIYYKMQRFTQSIDAYNKTYSYIVKSEIIERDFVLQSIVEDIMLKREHFRIEDLGFLSPKHYKFIKQIYTLPKNQYSNIVSNYRAITIITSDDLRENYPSI